VLANVGNVVQAVYVVALPIGPIWFLHGFYLAASGFMLGLHLRHHPRGQHPRGHHPLGQHPRVQHPRDQHPRDQQHPSKAGTADRAGSMSEGDLR
jgi:hypothetical protein